MWRYMFIGVVLVGAAVTAPSLLQQRLADSGGPARQTVAAPATVPAASAPEPHNPLAGRVARITADGRGHFLASARLNGRAVEVLVDTGATLVAINESTARRIGIRLSPGDFRYRVNTANGVAEAAAAVIDEIEIGRVIVRDVPATVARDSALSSTLLGMSFLNRLRKFEVDAGTLVLMQ
ncbi:MAG: hypothetical protein BroJett030_11040 [Alphaproteobacteria bacterium]|nr:MAG: hypothetical protein BroJett030_11040 [Alphaproteobacteria bacterium]